MKRHKIWYRRELFKNHFKSYKNWDKFNSSWGDKQPGRYVADALQCKNPECPREGMTISEHEAFYCFASQSFVKRVYLKVVRIAKKNDNSNRTYTCPFCGDSDVGEA